MINNTTQNRVAFALDNCGKQREAVADECNVGRTTVNGWRQRARIPTESLSAFSRATGFSIQWLVEGQGPERRNAIEHPIPVLLLSEVASFAAGEISTEDRETIETPPLYAGRRLCAVRITDQTMQYELNQGETVVIDIDLKTRTGQNGVFHIDKTDEIVIRKFIDTGTTSLLLAFNERYPNIPITPENPSENLGAILYKIKVYS